MSEIISQEKLDILMKSIKNFNTKSRFRNEANTKQAIIDPLLNVLGWNTLSDEVNSEYTIKKGTIRGIVDYALMVDEKPIVFVEAKSIDEYLTETYAEQVLGYCLVKRVKWAALTNGRQLNIYNTEIGETEEECKVLEIDIESLPHDIKKLEIFTKQSVISGDIDDRLEELNKKKKIVDNLLDSQDLIIQDISNILVKYSKLNDENIIRYIASKAFNLITDELEEKILDKKQSLIPLDKDDFIRKISRNNLNIDSDLEILVASCKFGSLEFLFKYNAWGYLNIAEGRKPAYIALYISKPEKAVQYLAKIVKITPPISSIDELMNSYGINAIDTDMFKPGKRLVYIEPGSTLELSNQIPIGKKSYKLFGLFYSSIKKLIDAQTTDDL